MIRRLIFLAILIFSPLRADWVVTCSDDSIVTLSICKDNLDREKQVFHRSFKKEYGGTEIEDMVIKKHGSLSNFLDAAFVDEEEDFKNEKENSLFVVAKNLDGEVVGFVAFDKHGTRAYERQLAVDPNYQRKGIGTFLSFVFLMVWPDCSFSDLVSRMLNFGGIKFYQRIGFRFSDYVHEGLDPSVYVGLERVFSEDQKREIKDWYTEV